MLLARQHSCFVAISHLPFSSLVSRQNYISTEVVRCRWWVSLIPMSVSGFSNFSSSKTNIHTTASQHQSECVYTRNFFSTMAGTILVQAQDPSKLCMEIQTAISDTNFAEAWRLYEQHTQMDGFPRKFIVNQLLASSAESLNFQWLEKAYSLVEMAFEQGKQNLLEKNSLTYLSYCHAKCGSPVPASTVLRKLVEMEQFPPVTVWSAVLAHLSQTAVGAYLAAELVLEIGYLFHGGRVDPRKKSNQPLIAMKPNTTAFNVTLAGCLLFGTTRKAEQLLDMMPQVGVKADPHLLVIMARIYERNGRRDELVRLQRHIHEADNLNDIQLRQFYNCLLTCHLKFGDLDSAAKMVLEMLRRAKEAKNSLAAATLLFEAHGNGKKSRDEVDFLHSKSPGETRSASISYEDFCAGRNFWKFEADVNEVLEKLLGKLQMQAELITTEHGILQPTERIFVKLVKAFLEAGKTRGLVEFLVKAENEDCPVSNDDSPAIHVVNSCISIGWLDQAHDLLDEMSLAGIRTGSSVYSSLLKAYCEVNQTEGVNALLRDARKAGIQLDSSCYDSLIQSRALQKDTQGALRLFREMKEERISRSGGHREFEKLVEGCAEGGEAGLMAKLLHEIKEGQRMDSGVHDWNNVVHFFCKKKLMGDAEKALKKMTSLGHVPNAQTFHSLVTGYAAVGGKYVEVTELWGEMKVLASSTGMEFDQELLDSVLYTFVRGGFFARANEVVEKMEKGKMFVDKYKYRALFLKYHKTLYKGKAPKVQTESRLKKREAALAFKRWVGLY